MKKILKTTILSSLLVCLVFPLISSANAIGPNTHMQRPALSPAAWEVKNTTMAALNLLFNYDYKNMDKQMQKASQYFTADGWKAYQETQQQTDNLQNVKAKKMKVSSEIMDKKMTFQMTRTAPFIWTVTAPIKVKYQTDHSIVEKDLLATAKLAQDQQHQQKIQQMVIQSK